VSEPRTASDVLDTIVMKVFEPQPIIRLELLRMLAPLAIVGFMSSRIIHADDWLSDAGFHVPAIDNDWRQAAGVPPLPVWAAWSVAIALALSGLAVVAGAFTRWTSGVFAVLLVYVALADRLAAFTVSKISPAIVIALCLSPAGARWSVDAWLRKRRDPKWQRPTHASWGSVRFAQFFLPIFYLSSGYAKARGEWLSQPYLLYSHLHDSYQTWVSWLLGNYMPAFLWTVLQGITLVFECGAPVWFALPWTRPFAFLWGVAMHAMIGLMFGPVIWFSLLMISLLVSSYGPTAWIQKQLEKTGL
jgi:uncharacterized membrane protein YphA (DoxX/SURF4 family)